jgi:hypothetical protein
MMDKHDLKGLSVADVLDLLERHKIGHRLAMEYFGYESLGDLIDTMHANGRTMPGHQPMRIAPETLRLIRQITRVDHTSSKP